MVYWSVVPVRVFFFFPLQTFITCDMKHLGLMTSICVQSKYSLTRESSPSCNTNTEERGCFIYRAAVDKTLDSGEVVFDLGWTNNKIIDTICAI